MLPMARLLLALSIFPLSLHVCTPTSRANSQQEELLAETRSHAGGLTNSWGGGGDARLSGLFGLHDGKNCQW